MLPNFLIIGAQKAATTWLAMGLNEHPDIFIAPIKEIHFFNHEFEQGLGWYQNHFKDWSGQSLVGEATPGYISYPETPARIGQVLGSEIKFIASLRHPVDRAYSAFWHYVSRGDIPANLDFRTAFQQGEKLGLLRFGLHERGIYFTHLSRYLQHFPRENFLILIYEEAMKDRQKVMSDCLTFLGANSQFVPEVLSRRVNHNQDLRLFHGHALALKETVAGSVNLLPARLRKPILTAGRHAFEQLIFKHLPKKNNYLPLTPALRQELLSHFMADIKQLEDLLGRDLSVWYAPSPRESN